MPPNQALQDSNPSPPDAEASDECGFSIDVEAAQPLSPSSTQQHTQTPLGTSLDGRSTQHGPAGADLAAHSLYTWGGRAHLTLLWTLTQSQLLPLRHYLVLHPAPCRPPLAGLWPRLRARCGVLWRRTKAETRLEWPLAKPRLLVILLCLIFQYIHAV